MQFSEQWLRSWVNPALNTEQLSELLTMAGLEVEETAAAAPAFSGVVIAEVKECAKHENADRLRVTKVDVGTGELIQIVCGAPNVAVGVRVPCALPGAVLPGEFKIKPTKMRGVESNGMLCSGKELGVPEDVDGLMLLPADAPVGQSIRDYLGLDDALFTLKITPNRADSLSIRGIAREVAALTGAELKPVAIAPVAPSIDDVRPVKIAAREACGRYLGRVLKGVNAAAATPDWMRQRLERSGLRSISAVVDITNYILLEQGQPMHAFDLARLDGGITVRMARAGESLLCLNEKTVELQAGHLVIADDAKVLAMGGIMGGEHSGVTTASRDIFLESAFFAPEAIAGKARELGFGSDSSYRYERGVDFELQRDAIERATRLVLDICGGEAGPVVEDVAELPKRHAVQLRVARVPKVLGVTLSSEEIGGILSRLGLAFTLENEIFTVQAPSFRFDIEIEEDLIEEVARVYGYNNIPSDAPRSGMRMLTQPEEKRPVDQLRHLLASRDYQEVVSYAFVDERWEHDFAGNDKAIRLQNPIASQMSVMRSTLIGGLVDVLAGNINRKHPRVRLFEVARVFLRGDDGFDQPEKVAGLAWGPRLPEQWGAKAERVDFFDAKADVEALLHPVKAEYRKAAHPAFHPGRCAEVLVDGKPVGVIGELHPQWVQAYDLINAPVLFELDLGGVVARGRVKAQSVSKFQPVRRDLALLVDEQVTVAQLQGAFAAKRAQIVTDIALFDVYRGKGVAEGKKSLAFSVLMQDNSRTLTDEDVEPAMQALLEAASELGAQLRV
ncbi:phenylalanine--tRNA ligase subunit beta [Chromobacterium sp. ATCC 53434]|uniref:phenylalanine--tRNA ligase subunit beta n=1 Tax=Chromobacterium sp. (strain ATCC 53434 / SC 14030) TaxID=2059672 RepID=UPI000C770B1B|nr:phenylalanine--tRNA ligase subunit beta [Chromobacterium sp. ATCC 53434]AUH52133.1 phenylalanine--tRNA ligase subunit beta [Chromobacterium sp. ATCC 53434]